MDDIAHRRQMFIDGLFFRVVACLFLEVVVLATALPSGLPLTAFMPAMFVVASAAALNGVYWLAGKARGFPLRDFYLHWMIDLSSISVLIYLLGGIDVPYGPFIYSMIVITSATFMSRRGSYLIAGGAALCLIALTAGEYVGVLPAPPQVWGHRYAAGGTIAVVVGAIVFFFMNAYLAGTLSDQLKMAKAEIEQHNRMLEERVRHRTHELEARTVQLQTRTVELEEMVHLVTHDLQNVAVAGTETARKLEEEAREKLSPRGQRYAERLVRDCRTMTTMLRNLLEVASKTEVAGRRENVDVAAIVRETVARAQGAIETKAIEVAIGDLPPVKAEHQKMGHVFENLLSNACKYVGDKPKPRIEVHGSLRNGCVEYVVRDNGVGIDPSQINRIFQMYHRAPDQMVAGVVQQGHGIGLAVVKRIVQRYGGKIWVESVRGEGSSFHLSFPRGEGTET